MSDEQFFYCLKHGTVEGADGCPPIDRLGPYASHDEASRALEKAAERNAEWDAEDARWNDDALEE